MLINPGSSRLHAATVAIDDPGPLINYLPPNGAAFGYQNDVFVALGEIARIETHSMRQAGQWWSDQVKQIENETEMPGRFGVGPLALGSFVFDPHASGHKSVMIIPETIIGRRNGQFWLTKIGYDRVVPALPPQQVLAQPPVGLRFEQGQLDDVSWMAQVQAAVEAINNGELEKVVLARDVLAVADEPIDVRWPLHRLAVECRGCWTYMIDGLIGSTPEMLVRRENGLTVSRVLAGTIARVDGVPDNEQAARLIASNKDQREHKMAVASVIDALSGHLAGWHAPQSPYVLTLPHLMHLATDVVGVSDPGCSTLELAALAHPTAAVCGTPAKAAREYIRNHEQLDRGRYAGPVGWVDMQGDGEWALALRCGQLDSGDPHRMQLFAGAGVVAESRPHSEFVETETKMRPMRFALADSPLD